MRRKNKSMDEHDVELWFRAVTRITADHLRCDYDRSMLAMYLQYLVDQPKREREALKDRLVTQLRLASGSKAENNEEFLSLAAVEVQEFLDTIKSLRAKVGPNESDLGQKLHGGDLGDANVRVDHPELTPPEEAFWAVLLKIDQMPAEQRKNLTRSDAFKLLKGAIEEAYKSRRPVDHWPDSIADES